MNKKLIIGLAVVLAAIGVYFGVIKKDSPKTNSNNAPSNGQNTQASTPSSSVKLAAQTVGQQADCTTYNFSELQKVWGVPFVDTDINKVSELSSAGGKLYSCSYNQTDSGQGATFAIEYREHPSVDSAKQSIADTLSTEKYGDKVYYIREDVAGVGDQAFHFTQNTDSPKNRQMFIRKGNVVFMLSGVNLSGAPLDYKDKLKASYLLHFN